MNRCEERFILLKDLLTLAPVLTLPSGDEGYTVYRNYLCFMTIKEARAELPAHDLEDMLWICVMDFGSQWDLHLPLIEFTYINSYHTSIEMAPYEVLYGRECSW